MRDRDEIAVGSVNVWNLSKKLAEYVPDSSLRKHIQSILSTNRYDRKPISDLGVISIGSVDFREFDDNEIELAREARLLLFLASLSDRNACELGLGDGHFMCTAENFQLTIQGFVPGKDGIAVQDGSIISISRGGYKVGTHEHHAPFYVHRPLRFGLDETLLDELLRLKSRQKRLYRRIVRATELFAQAYHNDSNVSHNSRILLQAGAFEILLDLPERGQRRIFKERVRDYTGLSGEKERSFWSERINRKERERGTHKVMWADRFYTLRNHIIHGEKVKPDEFMFFDQRHDDIAVFFFVLIVKKLINEKNRTADPIFPDEMYWGKTEEPGEPERKGFKYEKNTLLGYFRRNRTRPGSS